jgi:hypothetical protein
MLSAVSGATIPFGTAAFNSVVSISGSLAMLTATPGLVAGEQLGRRAASRLILEVNVGERLAAVVADDEAGVGLLDGPGRREAGEKAFAL